MFILPDSLSGGDATGGGSTNFSPYLSLFGGGMGAAADYNAGMLSSKLARANAGIAGLQAQSTQQAGAEQAALYQQHLTQTLGRQGASIGGANVTTSGSPLRSLESTAYLGAQDIARIQTNAARRAWGFDVTQQGDLERAQQDRSAGTSNALGSLITTGARAWGNWQGS